jgi:hypothetical protein
MDMSFDHLHPCGAKQLIHGGDTGTVYRRSRVAQVRGDFGSVVRGDGQRDGGMIGGLADMWG